MTFYTPIRKAATETSGAVYCPSCTHTVEAIVVQGYKSSYAKPGQKCARCRSSLDAGYVVRFEKAA